MDYCYDDIQVEDFYPCDFVSDLEDYFYDEDEDDKLLEKMLKSNKDF